MKTPSIRLRWLPLLIVTAGTLLSGGVFAQTIPGSVPGGPAGTAGPDVKWSARMEPAPVHPGETGRVVVSVQFAAGWHIYALNQPAGGPIATQIKLLPEPNILTAGPAAEPTPEHVSEPAVTVPVFEFKRAVAFGVPVKVAPKAQAGSLTLHLDVTYQICNDRFCLPPTVIHLAAPLAVAGGPVRPAYSHAAAGVPQQPSVITTDSKTTPSASLRTRQGHRPEDEGLLKFLTLAVLAGFLALATPCVFPMIPITVSYFTEQEGERGSNMGGALVYCLGIVGTFTGLGLLLAGLFGASGIARFAANAWVNLAIAAIFITLALSLMGYFELALPPALANRASALSGKGGLLGTLLMGLTFTLTSFTCTVPFVGTLLVSTTQGSWLWPALGMLAFSSAFASPFFLLALFPQLMGKMPRAGMWLIVVKAFMGFLELAAAIKFLSNADLVWQAHLLTRSVFLILWAAIGIASGLYLLGLLRLSRLDRGPVGPGRRGLGVLMVLAGLYCAAALVGAPLGPFDAYAPPEGYGFHHDAIGLHGWIQEYPPALAEARRERKPLFLDFTGYTCTNCRWMEANIFPQPAVQGELSRFVKAELYTDGVAQPSGHNRDLELKLFDTVALPLYAVVDTNGKPIDVFYGLTRDPQEFAFWLKGAREKSGLGG